MTVKRIQPVLGETIAILLGDGATPTESFTAPTLINTTRGFTWSTNSESDELVDLNNLSAPAQTIRRIKSTDLKVDGQGMIHAPDVAIWLTWVTSEGPKNVKILNGTYWTITGPMVLSQFQITGDRLKSSTCQITLEQAGDMTLVVGTGQ